MSDYYESNHRAIIEEIDFLVHLEAAAEDTRQRELTVSLGQVECRALHLSWKHICSDCKAAL